MLKHQVSDKGSWVQFQPAVCEEDGARKFLPSFGFTDPMHDKAFLAKAKTLLDEYLKQNRGESASVNEEEIPF